LKLRIYRESSGGKHQILRGCLKIISYDGKWEFQILSHNEEIGVSVPRIDFSNILLAVGAEREL
jgi:hypothetical protein